MKQFVPGFTANHWWSRDLNPGGPGSRAHSAAAVCVCVWWWLGAGWLSHIVYIAGLSAA